MTKKQQPTKVTESIPPKEVKVQEELSCDLNDVEWQNRARDLADANRAVNEAEERKKSVMAGLGSDVKIAKLKQNKLASVVADRRELREVTVIVRYDYEQGIVSKIRTDTDEVISEREMTDNERQSELDLLDANAFIADRHQESDNELEENPTGEKSPNEEDQE